MERGPLSLVSINEELLGRKCSGTGLESRTYGRRDPVRWPRHPIFFIIDAFVSLAIPSLQLRLTTSLFSSLDSKLKTN
jgi:hypothetical protein